MISKIYDNNLFAKLFSLGLLLLFVEAFKDSFYSLLKIDSHHLNAIPFFAIGATLCLVSLLFLLIEWVTLPFGTQTKRIKLYQGMGNLFAFAILTGGWFFKDQTVQSHSNTLSLVLSSSGFGVALLFSWAGGSIADLISRKKIKLSYTDKATAPSGDRTFGKTTGTELKTSRRALAPELA